MFLFISELSAFDEKPKSILLLTEMCVRQQYCFMLLVEQACLLIVWILGFNAILIS